MQNRSTRHLADAATHGVGCHQVVKGQLHRTHHRTSAIPGGMSWNADQKRSQE
ncbi:hypothetical protein KIL84_001396, partial [Mauremys mutica]